MENKRQKGSQYEQRAAEYLVAQGYEILEMNYRCRLGEIDLIAKDGRYLVFVEVKYRQNTKSGLPEEAVNERKQRVISKVAAYYCVRHGMAEDTACRFDVVTFLKEEVHLIKDAFSYQY